MKKAVILFASPHENGATKKLLDAFLSGLEPEEWETTLFDVCKAPVKPCTACGYCQKTDGCAFHDLDDFDAALRDSDLLVIASPVYNLTFPAQLKSVLDRFQRYFEARFARGSSRRSQSPGRRLCCFRWGGATRSRPGSAKKCSVRASP